MKKDRDQRQFFKDLGATAEQTWRRFAELRKTISA